MKAIRGATTASANTEQAISEATQDLLRQVGERNSLALEDVVSVFFSVTSDLDATYPARAARAVGWDVPMLDMVEMNVPGGLKRCIRVLVHVNRENSVVRHVYVRDAACLRTDLAD